MHTGPRIRERLSRVSGENYAFSHPQIMRALEEFWNDSIPNEFRKNIDSLPFVAYRHAVTPSERPCAQ
jgi:hypothetical protein